MTPDTVYRVTYTAAVTEPDSNCQNSKIITVEGAGTDYSCETLTGNFAPTSSSANYTYVLNMDNGNTLNLDYVWSLIGVNGTRQLATSSAMTDGNINQVFNGSVFAPADVYTLRVDVSSAESSHTCFLERQLTVGVLSVDYTFAVNNNAVEVGEEICLTNVSSTSHGDINDLTYAWDFGAANNSLGPRTSTEQQPPGLSFPDPGT
jgi:hypothetical protein